MAIACNDTLSLRVQQSREDKLPGRGQMRGHGRRHCNERCGKNISHNQVKRPGSTRRRMGKSVAPYRPDMRGQGIDFEILPRHPHRVGVIVAGKNMSAPRLGKRNCEYAGARADIGDLGRAAFFQYMRQQVQTPLGCLLYTSPSPRDPE